MAPLNRQVLPARAGEQQGAQVATPTPASLAGGSRQVLENPRC